MSRFSGHNRTKVKLVKKFGKYFWKEPKTTEELAKWKKENTKILWDVKTDQDILDLFCKLKMLDNKGP